MLSPTFVSAALLTLSLTTSVGAYAIEQRDTRNCVWTPIDPKIKPHFLQCGSVGVVKKPKLVRKFPSGGDWKKCRAACSDEPKCISYSHNHDSDTCTLYHATVLSSSPVWGHGSPITFWNHRCFTKKCHTVTTTKKHSTTKRITSTRSANLSRKKDQTQTKTSITVKVETTTTPHSATMSTTKSSTTASATPTNTGFIVDPSFEQASGGIDPALGWASDSGAGVTRVIGDAQDGNAFLRFDVMPTMPTAAASQVIDGLIPGRMYTLSGYYRIPTFTPGASANASGSFQVTAGNSDPSILFVKNLTSADFSNIFIPSKKTFTALSTSIPLGLELSTEGADNITADVDNIRLALRPVSFSSGTKVSTSTALATDISISSDLATITGLATGISTTNSLPTTGLMTDLPVSSNTSVAITAGLPTGLPTGLPVTSDTVTVTAGLPTGLSLTSDLPFTITTGLPTGLPTGLSVTTIFPTDLPVSVITGLPNNPAVTTILPTDIPVTLTVGLLSDSATTILPTNLPLTSALPLTVTVDLPNSQATTLSTAVVTQPTTTPNLPTADNISFEDAGVDSGAADWTPIPLSGLVVRKVDGTAEDGAAYLEITSSTLSAGSFVTQQFTNFVLGRSYTISVDYRPKTVNTNLLTTCTAQISAVGLGLPMTATATGPSNEWTTLSNSFTSVGILQAINIGIPQTLANCVIDFDNIQITENN